MEQSMKKIPLAQRLCGAARSRGKLPLAMGLCDIDFYEEVGAMTAQEEQYNAIYEEQIRPYRGTDDPMVRIYDLVAMADDLEDVDRQNFLFWLLVEPFATIHNQQNHHNDERKELR